MWPLWITAVGVVIAKHKDRMVLPLGVAGPLPSPLLLLLLIWAGMTLALPNSPRIHGRQEGTSSTATTTTTTTSSSATSSSTTSPATAGESAPGSQNLSTGLIVPLASVLGAAVLFAFLVSVSRPFTAEPLRFCVCIFRPSSWAETKKNRVSERVIA